MDELKVVERKRARRTTGSRSDPGMLWQSYRAACMRNENEVAHERFSTYLRLWVEAGEQVCSPPPMISLESDRFGILSPSIAFSVPGDLWLLSHRPHGLLTAVEEYIRTIFQKLFSSNVMSQLSAPVGVSLATETLRHAANVTIVVTKIAGCAENYGEIRKATNLVSLMLQFIHNLQKIIRALPSEENLIHILVSLKHSIAFFHSILDPHRRWQQACRRHHYDVQPLRQTIVSAPIDLVKLFTDTFIQKWDMAEACEEEWCNIQMEVVHMLGAILSSSEENACMAATPQVCLLLLTLLDPREKCTLIQALASKVVVKAIHVLHTSLPAKQQTSIDSGVMLAGFLNTLSLRYTDEALVPPCVRLVVVMLDVIPALVQPPVDKNSLKELFVEVGCFEKVVEALRLVKEQAKECESDTSALVCGVFRAFTAVMEQSAAIREGFEVRVGYTIFSEVVSDLITPTTAILQEALNMVVESHYRYKEDTCTIRNTLAVVMLVRWLLTIPGAVQPWLAARLCHLCTTEAHNRQQCCSVGLLRMVVEALAASQEEGRGFSEEVEESLIHLVEVLGSHSIQAAELKQVIGALRPLEDIQLPTYYYRLQKALGVMAHRVGKEERVIPLYYFDMKPKEACLEIPGLRHFPSSSGFSFHTWVCLDDGRVAYTANESNVFGSIAIGKRRRTLYSFYTSHDTGFEAFFTDQLVLVVATVTKKEFITVALKELPLTQNKWHSICVVYHVSKKPWSKTSEVCMYVDGELKRSVCMKVPNFSESFHSCCIGSSHSTTTAESFVNLPPSDSIFSAPLSPSSTISSLDMEVCEQPVMTTSVGSVVNEWGSASNLLGLISSLCMFTDSLSASSVKTLHRKGPNDLSLFQPKCPETHDLANKLYIYYHAKACKDGECIDLSPSHVADSSLNGKLKGQPYVTWDIKVVLSSLGGVQLLYPLLEQVDLPIKQREEKEGGEESKSNRKEEEENKRATTPSAHRETNPFDSSDGVASFLELLLLMLDGSPTNQQVFFLSEGPATIGTLLQKVAPTSLTEGALAAVQKLVDLLSHFPEQCTNVYRYLLFDFRIWSRPPFSVRIGHTQYISTIVKDKMADCRRDFGVQFMFDVIRIFYSSVGSTVPISVGEGLKLSEEEQQSIRAAIFMNVKLYVMKDIMWEELETILSFLVVTSDPNLQEETLQLLHSLLNSSLCQYVLGELLWDRGISLLVLIHAQSMAVRLLTIKIISHLCRHLSYNEFGPIYTSLHNGSLAAAICQMTQHELSSSIILALLELCVAKNKIDFTDYISHFPIYLAVLQLLRKTPLDVRHTICQQVISILHITPYHVATIAKAPGWESLFLWLLTPVEENHEKTSTLQEEKERETTYQRVGPERRRPSEEDNVRRESEEKISQEIKVSKERRGNGLPRESQREGGSGGCPPVVIVEEAPLKSNPDNAPEHINSQTTTDTAESNTSNLDTATPYRKRTNAFTSDRVISISNKPVVGRRVEAEKLTHSWQSQTHSSSWNQSLEEQSDEIWRTLGVVTETIGYMLWRSPDYNDIPPWKVWGGFFSSLDDFASEHALIVPAYTVKQRIFSLLINAITLDTKTQGVDRRRLMEVVLQLSHLFETFAISSYPNFSTTDKEEQDVLQLKLSHTLTLDLDTKHCSPELLEQYLQMLASAWLFESSLTQPSVGLDIAQSMLRVLLACIATDEKQYYVTATLKLQQLVLTPSLPKPELYFLLGHLSRVISEALVNGETERPQYLAAIVKGVFHSHGKQLGVGQQLPGLPDYNRQTFPNEFIDYCRSNEWLEYERETLSTEVAHYSSVLLPWLQIQSNHSQECHLLYLQNERLRREAVREEQRTYQEEVLYKYFELRDQEIARQKSLDSQLRNELYVTVKRWRGTRRFFTGERGAWSSRHPEPYLWKLDRTENFSRMRMKLSRNYDYNTHVDASRLRDVGSTPIPEPQRADASLLLAKVAKRKPSVKEEDEQLLEQLWLDANAPGAHEEADVVGEKEKIVRTVKCSLITLMDCNPGRLEVTTKHLYFFSDQQERKEAQTWYSTEFKVPLSQLREIHSRRYNMSRTAIEFFLVDQTNYFINFPETKFVSKVYRSIVDLNPPNLNRIGIHKPPQLLQASGLTQKWVRREISNFDYLMQLNTISGRSYNDLNQYPVFPWVLVDYSSDKLDLDDPKVYRDLSKPVGIQNPSLEESVVSRYEEFEDPTGTLGKFHYGSHYSNAAGVLHFLIRLEPFTTLHIDLQGGKFDYADRQFFSIPSTWRTIYRTGNDVKELIPEFFYLPEFLKNLNGFDLGKLQTGETLNDVILPKWASSPEDFIHKHRQALESEYVSAHLHEWIDLIFGYKQIGPEAVKARNVFSNYSYEDNVNLDSIKDEKERHQIESIINNFGQTPTRLFTEPHPQQLTPEAAQRNQAKGYSTSFTGRKTLMNLLDHLHDLKAHCVDISTEENAVVFVGTPSVQTRALLVSGNPEQLVTVTQTGQLNVHGWLPFSNSRNRPFTFQFDPNTHFDRSKWQYVGGPFAQDLAISPHLFVLSPNNKLLVTGGHWDNSFRVYSIEKRKLTVRTAHHNDIVTCMALDKVGTGDHLITGSRDTTCVIWKFSSSELFEHPLQTLYGHDSEVLCVDISTELDMAVSGAKDGTCIIHTVRHGQYLHTLHPQEGCKCEVRNVALSSHGRLVVYTEDNAARARSGLSSQVHPTLHLYNINGDLLLEKKLSECLNDLTIVDQCLITGNNRGFLTFRDLFSLSQLSSLNLLQPVQCVSVVLDHVLKKCTHLLVGLSNGKLIIVSVKDIHTTG